MINIDLNILTENDLQFTPTEAQIQQWYQQIDARLEAADVDHDTTAPYHVSITIVTPEHIQELNKEYRGKNYPTNILSFPVDEEERETDLLEKLGHIELGDLIICPEVLEREAQEQEKPLADHWTHICIHGMLHLLGYDHIEPDEAVEMESLEKELLAQLDIPDPYRDDYEIEQLQE